MISIVSTVRAPRQDLELFVAYHRSLGVGRIRLFFDDPADPSLAAFEGRDGVETVACTAEHWRGAGLTPQDGVEARQLHNAALAYARAQARGEDWLLHIDVDELIHVPDGDLAAWLAGRPAEVQAVVFPVWEAIPAPARRHPFLDCRLFKVAASARQLARARRLGCRRALRYDYFCGHPIGKAATRVVAEPRRIGIHHPTRADGAPLVVEPAPDARLLHYDGCTFEAWREKWSRRKDGSGRANAMRPSRRAQFEDFLKADATGSLSKLRREFRRQRDLPLHERAVLRALGMARRLELPTRLFDPAAGADA